MTNRIDDVRDMLAETLTPILPGRVWAYPTQESPGISIGAATIPTPGGAAIEVEFPVVCRYDGAGRAQLAGLEDLVARVWDACEALPRCSPVEARPDITGTSTAILVRVHIAARTLCPPIVTESFVPSEPVPA